MRTLFHKWEGIIKRQESGSIINLSPRTQNYRVNQFLDTHQSKQYACAVFNCAIQTNTSKSELKEFLDRYNVPKKKRLVVFVLNADLLLTEYRELLEEFDRYALENTQFTLLYFFQNNITYSWRVKDVAQFSSLLKNVYIEQLNSDKEVQYFTNKYAEWTHCPISSARRKLIINYCGGRLWLASEIIREYAKNKNSSITISAELERKIMVIWSEFLPIEQQVLKKIVFEIRITESEELEAFRYLRTIGVIIERGSMFKIRGYLLNQYINNNYNSVTSGLSLIGKDVFLNGVNISPIFSFRERILLKVFLLRKNELITREEVGTHLWNSTEFTDWAVDQAMRRIRIKLTKAGMKNKVINSVRGRGYVFN